MVKLIALLMTSLALAAGACGGMEWDRPSSKYRECVRENQVDPSVCDKYREQYEQKIDEKRNAPDLQHGEGRFHDL